MPRLFLKSHQPRGFEGRSALLYGSVDTAAILLGYAKRVAVKHGSSANRIYNRVYKKLSYSIWSSNAQAVILRRPKSVTTLA